MIKISCAKCGSMLKLVDFWKNSLDEIEGTLECEKCNTIVVVENVDKTWNWKVEYIKGVEKVFGDKKC